MEKKQGDIFDDDDIFGDIDAATFRERLRAYMMEPSPILADIRFVATPDDSFLQYERGSSALPEPKFKNPSD